MEININGIGWRKCGFCESWTNEAVCNCFEERINKDLKKIIDVGRAKNNHLIIISPNGMERNGMSSLGVRINKLKRGKE